MARWNTNEQWPELEKIDANTKVSYKLFNKLVYALLHLANRKENTDG